MAAIKGTSARNKLKGTAGSDTISGLGGNDDLYGLGGNDTLKGGDGNDTLKGGTGNDKLFGGTGADKLFGEAGQDILDGGTGADKMKGGSGNDTYIVDNASDAVTELAGQGTDIVRTGLGGYTLGAEVENLPHIGAGGFIGTGNDLANVIIGGSGGDTLTGLDGNDTLAGGAGDDVLIGGQGADALDGGGGLNDTAWFFDLGVTSGISLNLTLNTVVAQMAGGYANGDTIVNFENAVGTHLDDFLTGDSNANRLEGKGGDDHIDGRTGADTMIGGDGADSYTVDNLGDVVTELAGEGHDDISTALNTYTLAAGNNIEDLVFTGGGSFVGTGNELNNILIGGASDDQLFGQAGADLLVGRGGQDTLNGGSTFDTNPDTYLYQTVSDSLVATSDLIVNFSQANSDRIDLSLIDADAVDVGNQSFAFLAVDNTAFSGTAAEVRYHYDGIDTTFIEVNLNDGGTTADMVIRLSGQYVLTSGDFSL